MYATRQKVMAYNNNTMRNPHVGRGSGPYAGCLKGRLHIGWNKRVQTAAESELHIGWNKRVQTAAERELEL